MALVWEGAGRTRHRSTPAPSQLPPSARLVGRGEVFAELGRASEQLVRGESTGVLALDGPAGVGKTALAVSWAHHIRTQFPDGALFYDLRGWAANEDPAASSEVLEAFLRDLGVAPADLPPALDRRAALLRTRLAGTRTLIVLDNASTTEQVRPLLPGIAGCLVIVTSRRRLSGLAMREGAHLVSLGPLTAKESLSLLRDTFGEQRVARESEAAERIAALCAYLPLAIRVAAERVAAHPHLSLHELADELSAVDKRLDALSHEDEAVRAVFSWSYRALSDGAARLFRFLGLHAGASFSEHVAAALCGVPVDEARRTLGELAAVRLIEQVGHDRYGQHDLLGAYSMERARLEESEGDRESASLRMLDWYLHAAAQANDALAPQYRNPSLNRPTPGTPAPPAFTYTTALAWCDTELGNLVAATRLAHQRGHHTHAWQLPIVLWNFLSLRKHWAEWISTHEAGLAAARAGGDSFGEAWILNNLAHAHRERRRFDLAENELTAALALRRTLCDLTGEAWTLTGLGYLEGDRDDHDAAAKAFAESADVFRQVDDHPGEAVAVNGLGEAHRRLGRFTEALTCFEHALRIMRNAGDRYSEGYTLTKLGATFDAMDRHEDALAQFELALVARREIGDRWGEAETLIARGDAVGRCAPSGARASWVAALAILDELDDPRAADVRDRLGMVPVPRSAVSVTPSASTP
nr:tetratricopeptide repeat protein [Saccharothrix ecbatanensis]